MDLKITSFFSLSFSFLLFSSFSSRLLVACMVAGHNTHIAHGYLTSIEFDIVRYYLWQSIGFQITRLMDQTVQFVHRWSILFFPLAKVGYGSWHLIPGGTENELWVTAPGDD